MEKFESTKKLAAVIALALVAGAVMVPKNAEASKNAGCLYRITGKDAATVAVSPSGFTGMMTCNEKQLNGLVAELAGGMAKRELATATVTLANLNDFPSVRKELAKALSTNTEWDSSRGRPTAENSTLVGSEIARILTPTFEKHGYTVSSATIERLSVEEAKKQKIKGIEGRYPLAGTLNLVLTKK